jgi:hypothetical protein
VGRQAEIQKLQDYADRGICTLVLGPAGVGKSHLLKLLQGEKLIHLPGLSPQRETMLTLAEALYERGALKGNSEPAPKDFASFKRQHSDIGVQGWVRMVLEAVPREEWTLVIDDLSHLPLSSARLLQQLADRFVVIGAARQLKEDHRQYLSRFDRFPLSNLSRDETRQLIRLCTAEMAVEDFPFLEARLLVQSAGNPRALLRMVNRLRQGPVITPELVRRVHLPGARPQISLTPLFLVLLAVGVAAHYLALDWEDPELYVLAGAATALVVGAKRFLTHIGR